MKTNWLRLFIGRFAAGASLCAAAAFAQPQTAVMNDLRTKCVIDGIPAAPALSATWTGACIEGRASGFGEIYGFSAGRIRYILRGHFNVGRLEQQDSVRECTNSNCADDIPRSVLQLHEQHAAANPTATAAPATAAAVPALAFATPSAVTATPPAAPVASAPAVTAPVVATTTVSTAPNSANVVTSPLAANPPATATNTPATPAPSVGSAFPEQEIRVPNATFRGRFRGDVSKGGVISGEGRVNYDDGAVYEGPIVEGRKSGRGTYTWPDGLSYSGDWIDDQQTGRGKMRFKNGDSYEGDVIKGVFQGTGTYTQASGDTYTGDWVTGKREGRGVSQKPNGQRYEGEWRADRREGAGIETFPDGSRYDGQWRADQATGKGDIVFASGDAYTGEVVNGIPQGEGVYRWGSGDRFDGQFAGGKPVDAKGKMTFFFDLATASVKSEEAAKPETTATTPVAPTVPAATPVAATTTANNAPPALTRDALCIRAFNAASTQVALRRFLESYPDDDCGRSNIAKQKLAALVERERVAARATEERAAKAKAFMGATVAYVQEFPFCVVGSGASCQRVTYSFNVRAMIRDFDIQKRTAQVQVTAVESLGQTGNVQNPLFAQGRALATDTFRARMLGTTQTRTLDDLGIGGL